METSSEPAVSKCLKLKRSSGDSQGLDFSSAAFAPPRSPFLLFVLEKGNSRHVLCPLLSCCSLGFARLTGKSSGGGGFELTYLQKREILRDEESQPECDPGEVSASQAVR